MSKRLLLDSHAFLFAAAKPEELSPRMRRLLESEHTEIWVSVATLWELLLKAAKGKLDLGADPADELKLYCETLRLRVLPVLAHHAYRATKLKGPHKDPFDHMLAAQAQLEQLVLVSRDAKIPDYGVKTIW